MASGRASANAMTVDVEDFFQVSAMEQAVDRGAWDRFDGRVEGNVSRILELFAQQGVSATFFTLGWIAERYPQMVRRIVDNGHELASHGYDHIRVNQQTRDEFRADVAKARAILEDVGGVPVRGYRAASFSIGPQTPWAFEVLAETGHTYSSTTYPIRHDLYGDPDGVRHPYHPVSAGRFLEVPVATLRVAGRNWPCAGGGYFRLLPLIYGLKAIEVRNRRDRSPAVFYFHPWEIDPDQPRISGLSWRGRLRHYTNLSVMERKLAQLLRRFDWDRLDRLYPEVTR